MDDFQFTAEYIGQIRKLNSQLRKEELRARSFYKGLKPSLDYMAATAIIDDYNFNERLMVFSDDKYYNKRYQVEYGDAIHEGNSMVYMYFGDQSFNENWSELRSVDSGHPLAEEHFCYLMHCIVFESPLAWEDIYAISDIWLEFKVDYQFITDKEFVTDIRTSS